MSRAAGRVEVSTWPDSTAPERARSPRNPGRRGIRLTPEGTPALSRDGIAWKSTDTNVEISIDVVNPHDRATNRGWLVVEAAPLGAFVTGVVVGRLPVGPIGSHQRRRIRVTVPRSELPAPNLVTELILARSYQVVGDREVALISSAEWVGNLNVWFDTAPAHAVEVHRAFDLRVGAGRAMGLGVFLPSVHAEYNLAVFKFGTGWSAGVIRVESALCLLLVKAPGAGARCIVNLHVTRRADSRTVPVDFTFESVDGPGQSLGCVRV
jgi:hypothetical protein